MPRGNGSYTGFDVSPTVSTASGIWTVREAETLLRANKWPATPTVPGAPSGTAGDEEVSLTWTAPTGGSTVTDYEVQYSSDAGSTWTTFSDGVSTATSATVTGLTNGTGYIFRVRAINALGEGPYGSSSGTITPASLGLNLIAYWSFDSDATDASANSYDLTSVGTPTSATGILGNCYSLSTGNRFYYADADPFIGGSSNSVTVNFWVKHTTPSQTAFLVCAMPDSSPYHGWQSALLTDGTITAGIGGSGGPSYGIGMQSSATVDDDAWHMITLVMNIDTEVTQLWIDAVMEDDYSIAGWVPTKQSGAELAVGYRQGSEGAYTTEGKLDEIAIWGRALPQADIEALYNSGAGVAVL